MPATVELACDRYARALIAVARCEPRPPGTRVKTAASMQEMRDTLLDVPPSQPARPM